MISTVFNQLGAMLGGGVVGAIFFAVVFLIGHSMNMAINLLGAYVHTNRLPFVGFFGRSASFVVVCIYTRYPFHGRYVVGGFFGRCRLCD